MTTSPQIHFSILTNLASLNTTETLLVSPYNKLVAAVSHQRISCLCLLDISAAFDTIDHTLLLHRLSSWFGISGTALLWFKSYLSSRSFSVKASNHTSQPLRTLLCPSRLRPGSAPLHSIHHTVKSSNRVLFC